ncbi:MAG: Haloacid dehalogenase domain protein hydrolase [Spartobacteria bacterium]|nr:Haloacid dehalogenase domain protein hydrolase [Spartobacteria bacterium]
MDDSPSAATDRIHIKELEVFARVGVPENERASSQRLTLTMTLWPGTRFEDMEDNIQRTVNYAAVCETARNFVSGEGHRLIETLASQLASHLLQQFPLRMVEVEVRKFILPETKYVSVTVQRNATSV